MNYSMQFLKNGNAWGVILGSNVQVGMSGGGDTPSDALRNLAKAIEAEGWKPGDTFSKALTEENVSAKHYVHVGALVSYVNALGRPKDAAEQTKLRRWVENIEVLGSRELATPPKSAISRQLKLRHCHKALRVTAPLR